MSRLLAIAALALAFGGCSEPRQVSLYYNKADVSDVEAAKDKKALQSVSGVRNVMFEPSAGGIRAHIMVEDGKELNVYEKADELGYIRQK
jgi:PBP1b-binding outer membrane lipoprotein LpoB